MNTRFEELEQSNREIQRKSIKHLILSIERTVPDGMEYITDKKNLNSLSVDTKELIDTLKYEIADYISWTGFVNRVSIRELADNNIVVRRGNRRSDGWTVAHLVTRKGIIEIEL